VWVVVASPRITPVRPIAPVGAVVVANHRAEIDELDPQVDAFQPSRCGITSRDQALSGLSEQRLCQVCRQELAFYRSPFVYRRAFVQSAIIQNTDLRAHVERPIAAEVCRLVSCRDDDGLFE